MNETDFWRLSALSLLTVLAVAAYHVRYGDMVVLSFHRLEVELTSMGLKGYNEGWDACVKRTKH